MRQCSPITVSFFYIIMWKNWKFFWYRYCKDDSEWVRRFAAFGPFRLSWSIACEGPFCLSRAIALAGSNFPFVGEEE